VLQKDIAETSTKFKEEDLGTAPAGPAAGPEASSPSGAGPGAGASSPSGAAPGPGAAASSPFGAAPVAAPAPAKKKKTISAFVFTYGLKKYLAVPVMGKGGSATSFDIFGEGDKKRLKKLGTMIADAQGNPTNDIVIF
jgi:hypothetical protein